MTISHWLVKKDWLFLLKIWIMLGIDIDTNIYLLGTPLHFAIETNNFAAAQILILAGANINAEKIFKITPFYISVSENKINLIKLLIDHNADTKKEPCAGLYSLETLFNKNQIKTNLENLFFQEYEKKVLCYIEKIMIWKAVGYEKQLNYQGFDDVKYHILKMMTSNFLQDWGNVFKKIDMTIDEVKVNLLTNNLFMKYAEKEDSLILKQINLKSLDFKKSLNEINNYQPVAVTNTGKPSKLKI